LSAVVAVEDAAQDLEFLLEMKQVAAAAAVSLKRWAFQ
jgi:hypothetical protein